LRAAYVGERNGERDEAPQRDGKNGPADRRHEGVPIAVHVALLDSTRRTASPDSEPPGITPFQQQPRERQRGEQRDDCRPAPQERVVLEPSARPRNVCHESGAPMP
jgi:hypothetical protein